jgi:hypothetical protein
MLHAQTHNFVGELSSLKPRWPSQQRNKVLDGGVMDKFLYSAFNGAFSLVRGPLIFLLMASIVVSLVRNSPARLARAHAHKALPPA